MKCRRLRKQTTACSAGLDSWYDIVEKIASEHFSVSRHPSLYEVSPGIALPWSTIGVGRPLKSLMKVWA